MVFDEVYALFSNGRYKDALELIESLQNSKESLYLKIWQSRIYEIQGHYEESLNIANEVLKVSQSQNNHTYILAALVAKIYVAYRQGKLIEAWGMIDQGKEINEQINDRSSKDAKIWQGYLHNVAGIVYYNLGMVNDALDSYSKAINIAKAIPDMILQSNCQNNLGVVYRNMGRLDEALEITTQALDILNPERDNRFIPILLTNLGIIYRELGNIPQAVDYLRQGLQAAQDLGNQYTLAETLFDLVRTNLVIKNYDTAKYYVEKLEKVAEDGENKIIDVRYKITQGLYFKSQGSFQAAEQVFQTIVDDEELLLHNLTIFAILNLCELKLARFQPDKDSQVLDELSTLIQHIDSIAHHLNSFIIIVELAIIKSKLYTITGELLQAKNELHEAINQAKQHGLVELTERATKELVQFEENIKSLYNLSGEPNASRMKTNISSIEDYITEIIGKFNN